MPWRGFSRIGVVTLLAGSIACATPVPNAPAQITTALTINPFRDALNVAQRVQFVAMKDGRVVDAAWSSSDTEVIIAQANGAVVAVAPGVSTIRATADGETASVVLRVVPDFRGTYAGGMEVEGCRPISGAGPLSDCERGVPYRINSLVIDQQDGSAVAGNLNLFLTPTAGRVSGTVDTNEHVVLTGTATSAGAKLVIERWDIHLTEPGGQLLGLMSGDLQFTNGFGPQHWRMDFTMVSVRRQ